ncbi:carbamoyl-phosphate synthase large subunit [Stenotrophobium rhamnosiphilum]|uniref:Carbamoyl phosphate synthase large chain n=1 Tax=Stenotrophobium rhamnosiphilum TaxID=2029166 RepID=A0A2T5MHL5_9GAMM|nr:carbamoyl-phosphate synthase large subunit [Stenotrophobium rhamnosiphilum]PTU32063.1 carbamoyl phosphate synthase large subunit [Stenotrophobium rhamnosiphilum]
MPKRTDIKSILIIGAGPIVIGQACEFDYSGAQACKALREEGYRVILVNSNPATIMTDPETADATYIEPIRWETVARIIEKERPDALLPTMGGQTALNCALDLSRHGVLDKFGVQMIGANEHAIDLAEDRQKFRDAMTEIGLGSARSGVAHTMEEARKIQTTIGYPVIIRPSFTLGGTGGGVAYNVEEFEEIVTRGLDLSPTTEVLIEESLLGWKEYEMEVVRDRKDNCIIICSIENFDPMGVHTGDSITVAPAQTLTDKEYQIMRDASIKVLRKIGVDTGGSNVQFSINPEDGRMIVIEMNPRVSRSSALASKATGFPIAKVAAKLAVGYTLDELRNEITGGITPTSFEPSIDYVVTKIPRFTFEKFPQADSRLTTQMKSVGEVMAIGRNFQESLQKAMRGLEVSSDGFDPQVSEFNETTISKIREELITARAKRLWYVGDAFRAGMSVSEVFRLSKIDPWFLEQIEELIKTEDEIAHHMISKVEEPDLRRYKRLGFSDRRLAKLMGVKEDSVRARRHKLNVRPVYKRVDTCAAEFPSSTAYLYSSYDEECEAAPSTRDKIIVLGGGPNRIGQGIEFDYCCVHASMALREDGYETIMINCNPETVSTDYDTSDRLYFEPLTFEDVMEIIDLEKPKGVIVQFGGQTPLKLSRQLEAAGAPIIGTSPDSIDLAEDRERFQKLVEKLKLLQPPNGTATSEAQALAVANKVGYPLVVRPSYVLGGRAMEIVHDDDDLNRYMTEAVKVSNDSPVLLDRFLNNAIEVDVDALSDGTDVVIGGIMEHIEEAGVHSGDSACSLPAYSLPKSVLDEIRSQMVKLAHALKVIGLMNAQFAVQGEKVYLLEVNPRASRTSPFVSKATGRPLAKIAARCMAGKSLKEQGIIGEVIPPYYSVKESVFPFAKFPAVDPLLGPEMRSTGEVMGVGAVFGEAFNKALLAAGVTVPSSGTAFISVREGDKPKAVELARLLSGKGFRVLATHGTAALVKEAGIPCEGVNKVKEGRPHCVDMIKNGEIHFIANTTEGKKSIEESRSIRGAAIQHKICYFTTIAGALAAAVAMDHLDNEDVNRLQDLHAQIR